MTFTLCVITTYFLMYRLTDIINPKCDHIHFLRRKKPCAKHREKIKIDFIGGYLIECDLITDLGIHPFQQLDGLDLIIDMPQDPVGPFPYGVHG